MSRASKARSWWNCWLFVDKCCHSLLTQWLSCISPTVSPTPRCLCYSFSSYCCNFVFCLKITSLCWNLFALLMEQQRPLVTAKPARQQPPQTTDTVQVSALLALSWPTDSKCINIYKYLQKYSAKACSNNKTATDWLRCDLICTNHAFKICKLNIWQLQCIAAIFAYFARISMFIL